MTMILPAGDLRLPGLKAIAWMPAILLAVAVILAATEIAAPRWSAAVDLYFIIVMGLPHGALDSERARPFFVARYGRGWFFVFAIPYLALAALFLMAWRIAPLPTLAIFLGMSTWHFGDEPNAGLLKRLVMGGAPIALPVLFQPVATAALLTGISGVLITGCPIWLVATSLAWAILAICHSIRQKSKVGQLALIAALYAVLSPLTALAIYFVCLHSPAHMRHVAEDPLIRARVGSLRRAIGRSLPTTLVTLAIGVALWPLYRHWPGGNGVLALTIQGLAALTLPHMLLDGWLAREGQYLYWIRGRAGCDTGPRDGAVRHTTPRTRLAGD
jgi:Brp/Blh family beta-carotene 15,15'-monooxygenase